ncbi:MAG: hypothetical protein KBS42_05110 [Bacteroidales bacterium]|nr:hypothetical protein [Candidatus Colicola coprequi]
MTKRLYHSYVTTITHNPYRRRSEGGGGGGGEDEPLDALYDADGYIVLDRQGSYIIPK